VPYQHLALQIGGGHDCFYPDAVTPGQHGRTGS